jgi:hypothetical protein
MHKPKFVVNRAFDRAPTNPCLARLSQIGALADLATPKAGQGRGTAKSDNRLTIPNIDETLAANGLARLLPVLPFGTQTVARLQEFALIATLLETVRRTLKLDLATATPDQLAHSLERISRNIRLPLSRLSRPEAAAVGEFARITPAAISLRKIGIDIFAKNGAHDLEHWMASPVTGAALAQLSERTVASATLQNLTRLAGISLSTPSMQRAGGEIRTMAANTARHTTERGPRIERLATLLPVIESAKLPRPVLIDEHNAEFAALKVVEKATGLAPDDAATGPRISELMAPSRGAGSARPHKPCRSVPRNGKGWRGSSASPPAASRFATRRRWMCSITMRPANWRVPSRRCAMRPASRAPVRRSLLPLSLPSHIWRYWVPRCRQSNRSAREPFCA